MIMRWFETIVRGTKPCAMHPRCTGNGRAKLTVSGCKPGLVYAWPRWRSTKGQFL